MNFIKEVGPDPIRPMELEDIPQMADLDRKKIEKENRLIMKYLADPECFASDLQLLTTEDFDKANVSNVYNLILMFEQTLSGNKEPTNMTPEQKLRIFEALEECFSSWRQELTLQNDKPAQTGIDYSIIMEISKIISRFRFERSPWATFQIEQTSGFLEMEKFVKELQEKFISRISNTARKFKRDRSNKKMMRLKNSIKKFILKHPRTYAKQKFFNDFKHFLTKKEVKSIVREAEGQIKIKKMTEAK